ncbi:galactosylceramide sulfotransferase-like [Amphiura filiformis]|uniref:galactosylceramide sulfotransferase-like n=1 Tax=Amphiura filiformis TaxID=82378 RepID=UPI003B20D7E0
MHNDIQRMKMKQNIFIGILVSTALIYACVSALLYHPPTDWQPIPNRIRNGTIPGTIHGIIEKTSFAKSPLAGKCGRNFVYIKVHKAASSLLNQILLRYGISTNKTLALPRKEHYFDYYKLFQRNMVFDYKPKKFQMLINHARYNRLEMKTVVPNALYFATLRDPVTQFESSFGYFRVSEQICNQPYPTTESLQLFFSNPKHYLKNIKYGNFTLWNGQIFDLGLHPVFYENRTAIKHKIQQLEEEFDLILITEYIDESLILLKNIMCLNFTDILYLPSNVRSNKFKTEISRNLSTQIKNWNTADVMLYEHFNRTLWNRIYNEGPKFFEDLETFRVLKQETFEKCVNYSDANVSQRNWILKLKENCDYFCRTLTKSTVRYVNNLRQDLMKENEERKRKDKEEKNKEEKNLIKRNRTTTKKTEKGGEMGREKGNQKVAETGEKSIK